MKLYRPLIATFFAACIPSFGVVLIGDEFISAGANSSTPTLYSTFSYMSAPYGYDQEANDQGAIEFDGASIGTFDLGDTIDLSAQLKSYYETGEAITGVSMDWSVASSANPGTPIGGGNVVYTDTGTGTVSINNVTYTYHQWETAQFHTLIPNTALAEGEYIFIVTPKFTYTRDEEPFEEATGPYSATFTVVPESSVALLGGLGLLGLLRRRRK